MDQKRPLGRDKKVTGSASIHKRGDGLGTGPVGSTGGPKHIHTGPTGPQLNDIEERMVRRTVTRGARRAGISLPVLILIIVLAIFLFRGGCGAEEPSSPSQSSQSVSSAQTPAPTPQPTPQPTQQAQVQQPQAQQPGSASGYFGQNTQSSQSPYLYGTGSAGSGTTWSDNTYQSAAAANTGVAVETQAPQAARAKRTQILGNGRDVVTILVYMCGTDLESGSGMATNDLVEMTKATIADNVNLIVYTGSCKRWQNNIISTSANQIYQVKSGGLNKLVENAGNSSLVYPDTLASFIKWGTQNFPANRTELIFWDHGGGTISGYGYDETNSRAGSMGLSEIDQALKSAGVTFDFIGFDTCLMATVENALMLDDYADYLIASEETEPGTGWYYTNWLTSLSRNTSIDTLELGRQIIDDFTVASGKLGGGYKTTLSIVDLPEAAATIPSKITAFSQSIRGMISQNNYKAVSDARYCTREFGSSSRIDQIDLAHFADNIGDAASRDLSNAVKSAVKYNRTSANMTNAYGLSIYFPYQRASYVDKVCNTYAKIEMDEEYTKAIQEFASLQTSGHAASGGYLSPFESLLGGGNTVSGSSSDEELLFDLLQSLMGGSSSSSSSSYSNYGGFGGLGGLNSGNTAYFGRSIDVEDMAEYVADHQFAGADLTLKENENGLYTLTLSQDQWDLVHALDENLFYDDGEGYMDLGLDNLFAFDEEGNMIADTEGTWLALNGQPVAYYHEDTVGDEDDYYITGRIPVYLNDVRADLVVVFDSEHPEGYISGARTVYDEEETLTLAKSLTEIKDGDKIDLICDYYSYDGDFMDSYMIGDQITVDGDLEVSNVSLTGGDLLITYRLTDIYNQTYWTNSIVK